jgi:hypothetical protein
VWSGWGDLLCRSHLLSKGDEIVSGDVLPQLRELPGLLILDVVGEDLLQLADQLQESWIIGSRSSSSFICPSSCWCSLDVVVDRVVPGGQGFDQSRTERWSVAFGNKMRPCHLSGPW